MVPRNFRDSVFLQWSPLFFVQWKNLTQKGFVAFVKFSSAVNLWDTNGFGSMIFSSFVLLAFSGLLAC